MRTYDGADIKYLLEKKGCTLTSVAADLGVSPACVHHVIWGNGVSARVVEHIERLLGMDPGTLKVSCKTKKQKRTSILRAA